MISDDFWKIAQKRNCIILASGGIDSSYVILKFFEQNLSASLLHCDTRLQLSSAKKTIEDLVRITNYPLIIVKPEINTRDVLLRSFAALDQAYSDKTKGEYNRNIFACCLELKKKPALRYYKTLSQDSLIISAITPSESNRRRMFLGKIRNQNRWMISHSKYGVDFAYPLRDSRTKEDKENRRKYIEKILGVKVKSSGCRICPIVLLFKMWKKDPITYTLSKRFFLRNFKNMNFCGMIPLDLEDFLNFEGET